MLQSLQVYVFKSSTRSTLVIPCGSFLSQTLEFQKFSTLTSNMEMHFLVCTSTAILDFILKLTLDLQLNMNIREIINIAIHLIYTNNCFLHMQQHHTNQLQIEWIQVLIINVRTSICFNFYMVELGFAQEIRNSFCASCKLCMHRRCRL